MISEERQDKFNTEMKALGKKYNVGWQVNCDLPAMVTGLIYSGKLETDGEDEWSDFITQITGIDNDPEGAIKLLKEELEKKYGF